MIIVLKVIFCSLLAFVAVALSEVLWHKYLFHSDSFGRRFLSGLWGYDPDTHDQHHQACKNAMEDTQSTDNDYRVQQPSNVAAGASVAVLFELPILLLLQFENWIVWLNVVLTFAMFWFWYKLEDHFHLAMHKKTYYQTNIEGTWQQGWFKYLKRLHAIHHRDPGSNFGFVFFPVGDLLIGTYRPTYRKSRKPEVV